ncbi:MAG: DUF2170 family protein [Methylococcales bacterium]|jgi:uncharacterized protein|nr:DUF2170 family protein [Methylococcales bacterium]
MEAKLDEILSVLSNKKINDLFECHAEIIEGEVNILQVIVDDREEFPIYITVDESQILCITHLWHESEVQDGKREELMDALLTMNIPMPLSAFSKVGDQYILFGALSPNSLVDDILHEIDVLSDNTLDAVEASAEYLK